MATNLLNNSIEDQLRVEGVNSKGFGQLAKYVITSPELDPKAKLIYSCLVSHTGNDKTAFPGRDLIVQELGINKDTYYKHLTALTDKGFVSVESMYQGNLKSKNIYTIKFHPFSIEENPIYKDEGVYCDGWGLIPNLVFRDDRLSWKAKLIYSYLSVYADHKDHICNPSPSQMNKELGVNNHWSKGIFKELIDAGYLYKVQKIENGRFSGNYFRLIQNPEIREKIPHVTFSDTGKPDTEDSYIEKPDAEKQYTTKPDTVISDTNNRISNNTNINNTNSINPSTADRSEENERREKERWNDAMNYEQILAYKRDNGILPYEKIINNSETRALFIKGLIKTAPKYSKKGEKLVMMTMQNGLFDMLSQNSRFCFQKVPQEPSKVLNYIEQLMDIGEDMGSLFDAAKTDYETAQKEGYVKTKDYSAYLMACFYNRLRTGNLDEESDIKRDFGAYYEHDI